MASKALIVDDSDGIRFVLRQALKGAGWEVEVAVVEAQFPKDRVVHDRYQIQAAPITVIADRDGVVRGSFVGAYTATDLWNAVAELRS